MNDSQPTAASTRALLDRARHYCALSEQCETGVRQKLITWGASSTEVEHIIASLRSDDYLNDMRYARAYAESKIMQQHWGRQKVLYQLRQKHLPKEAIAESMSVVSDEAYLDILATEASKKLHSLGGSLDEACRRKLMSFLASRGFSLDEINHVITNTLEQ